MASVTGLDLPMGSKRVSKNGFALIGTVPGQWLAVAESREARSLPAMLAVALKGDATVVDLSDGKAVLRISGPRARATLAKGCSLDLHPRVFKPGNAATTPVALIDCVIWQIDETPTYDLAVPTSYAESFWSWLTASAAEYGYTVK
jgi:sarcosine oxidase subunit gamma